MSSTSYGHHHGRYCYWDLDRCGWVCHPDPSEDLLAGSSNSTEATETAPAASAGSASTPTPEPAPAATAGATA